MAQTGSGNGLALNRQQAIIWTIAGLLLFQPFKTSLSEIVIKIQEYS